MSTEQQSFAIQGMFCARCAVTIEQVLMRLDGLISASVNFASERAMVTFDPTRIALARIVDAVNDAGYSVPLEHITWYAGDLLYASAPGTVRKVLGRCRGVVRVTTIVASGQIKVEGFAGSIQPAEIEQRLHQLGLGFGSSSRGRVAEEFAIRGLLATAAALVMGWTALYAMNTTTGVLLMFIAALGMFGAGWPFYRHVWAAVRQREYDTGVGTALLSTAMFAAGATLSVNVAASPVIAWAARAGVLMATWLIAGWFIARGFSVWGKRAIENAIGNWLAKQPKTDDAMEPSTATTSAAERRRQWLPPLTGIFGAAALLGLYLGVLSVAQSPSHALEQLRQDQLWVGLVILGFGIQIGLYVHLRLLVQALHLAGATAITGVGTGTSTLGMFACCAHHVTDIAPLMALTGASGLTGLVTFMTEWKIPFILLGLTVNVIGIVLTGRTIRSSQAHLAMMSAAIPQSHEAVPACH
jgi:copper chaperone CopZ